MFSRFSSTHLDRSSKEISLECLAKSYFVVAEEVGDLDFQPEEPALAQRLATRERQQTATEIVSEVVQMRRNRVDAASEVEIHREVDGLRVISLRKRDVVLELARDVELVPEVAAQRVQVVVLLLDLHRRLAERLLALELALRVTSRSRRHSLGHRDVLTRRNVQLAATALPHGLRHLQHVAVDHPADLAEDVERLEDGVEIRLVETLRLERSPSTPPTCSRLPCVRMNTVF